MLDTLDLPETRPAPFGTIAVPPLVAVPARRPPPGRPAPARPTAEERQAVGAGRWFAALPVLLRHDILSRAVVRRHRHGAACARQGQPAEAWMCVARGAVRLSSGDGPGRAHGLAYLKPGHWFGDLALVDGRPHPHDAQAHGETTLLCVPRADFLDLLARHRDLAEALLRLNCGRVRALSGQLDEVVRLPLAVRVARQLRLLLRGYGVPQGEGRRIGLRLAQEDLAQLLGASRQRVNGALRALERDGIVALDARGIVVRDAAALDRAAQAGAQSPTSPLRIA